jgi:tRNA nucleotidyltransferase (CCA-adding enzyme)
MLGTFVRVRVTNPIHSLNTQFGYEYKLNYGNIEGKKPFSGSCAGAYIVGVDTPVRTFDGKVVAAVKRNDGTTAYIVSPKNVKYICHQIEDAIEFAEKAGEYKLECLYERSCGAVVYRIINGELRYLLIKNRRSTHWGFPKGHIERGEISEQTAMREVLEETGIHINIIPKFALKSEYSIQERIEKSVIIFLASTNDTQTTIQKEEIEDYIWLGYDKAMDTLHFPNDRNILKNANDFIVKNNLADISG